MKIVDLATERAALEEAQHAVQRKLKLLAGIAGGGADALADEYIDAVVAGTIEKLQQELVVFGRIDDDQPWRIGLYGIDAEGEQLVVDWRAPFAAGFYRARFGEAMGLERRVTYVGAIQDLFVEELATGEVSGTSPLMGELSRSRGREMRAAVATLQSEQDELVRLGPAAKLVLRGGPGTGKTVVGLHRAAWLVYNDTSLTAGRILVIGPSDKFLRFVSAVLPTLGEARIAQTTFERLLGPSGQYGSDPRWLDLLDRFEDSLLRPDDLRLGPRFLAAAEVAELTGRIRTRVIPWREKRKVFVNVLANRYQLTVGEVSKATSGIWPVCTAAQARKKLRNRKVLERLGADGDLIEGWLAEEEDGAWADEVRSRFEGVPATYGHVIVDEAQDLTLMQLRAVQRRATGLSLVGDDAQRSNPNGLGLRYAAELLDVTTTEMATAYRMSAEIAGWLNRHAAAHGIDAVELVGIRPTGREVGEPGRGPGVVEGAVTQLSERWPNVTAITVDDVWSHKGVEYDGVVVDTAGMAPGEVYLAASRAAHELVVIDCQAQDHVAAGPRMADAAATARPGGTSGGARDRPTSLRCPGPGPDGRVARYRGLPGFDQYVLGPGTAAAEIIVPEQRSLVSRAGGWIAPVVIAGGRVVGVWNLDNAAANVDLFEQAEPVPPAALDAAVDRVRHVVAVLDQVDTRTLIARRRNLPPVDPQALRADIDEVIDQTL